MNVGYERERELKMTRRFVACPTGELAGALAKMGKTERKSSGVGTCGTEEKQRGKGGFRIVLNKVSLRCLS